MPATTDSKRCARSKSAWGKRCVRCLKTAAGVPLQCDEPADFMTFRVGLFGLKKLHNLDRSVAHLAGALDALGTSAPASAEAVTA